MDSEQLRLLRRIGAVRKQLGTALSLTGGSVSGGLDVKQKLTAAGGMAVTGGIKVSGQIRTAGALSAGNGRLVVSSDSGEDVSIDGKKVWHAGNASQAGVTLFAGSVSSVQTVTLTQSFKGFRFVGITLNRASATSHKMTVLMPAVALNGTNAWVSFYNGSYYYVRLSDSNGNLGISTVGADTCLTRIAGFN